MMGVVVMTVLVMVRIVVVMMVLALVVVVVVLVLVLLVVHMLAEVMFGFVVMMRVWTADHHLDIAKKKEKWCVEL